MADYHIRYSYQIRTLTLKERLSIIWDCNHHDQHQCIGTLNTTRMVNLVYFLFAALLQLVFVHGQEGFYDKSPVGELTPKLFKSQVLQSNQVSVVEFYAPWCGHCRNLKSDYVKAAKMLQGLANVYAVNCDDSINTDLCTSQQIQGFPTIKVFRPPKVDMSKHTGKLDAQKPVKMNPASEQYNGGRDAKSITDFALSRLRNYVHSLSNIKHYTSFTQKDSKGRPKAIFLQGTEAKTKNRRGGIPPLVKVVASEFLYDYDIAFVSGDAKGAEAIWNELGVAKPTSSTLIIIDGHGDGQGHMQYDGPMSKEEISVFLKTAKSSAKKAGSKGHDDL